MPRATVHFTGLHQDSQDYGSNDEHMVSRVFLDLEVDGRSFPGLHANVKQVVGSSYETGPIEVSSPVGYGGPMNHTAFSSAVERYYRGLVGSKGSGIRIEGATNVRMRNNRFQKRASESFDVSNDGKSW